MLVSQGVWAHKCCGTARSAPHSWGVQDTWESCTHEWTPALKVCRNAEWNISEYSALQHAAHRVFSFILGDPCVGVRSTLSVPAQVFCVPKLFYLFLTLNERRSKTPNKHSSSSPMLPGGCVCCHVRSSYSHKFSLPIFLCKSLG